jgi:glycosyltransferase involved in cell wall biosynthesis
MGRSLKVKNMDKPLVSAVISTRDRCALLPRAMESILNQTYDNLEVIVVDDASRDATPEVINRYRDKFKNFKYIRNDRPYEGAKARNIGVTNATGKYIAFLDDDDEWLPRKIESQLAFLETHPEVMLVSCWFIQDLGGKRIGVKKYDKISFEHMLWENFLGSFSFIMARREVFEKIGFLEDDLTGADDWEFFIRVSRDCKVGVVNEFLTVYYWHSGNISRKQCTLHRYAKVYEKYKGLMSKNCRKKHIRKLVIDNPKLIKGTSRRLKNFGSLLKKYNVDIKHNFLFIAYGFLTLGIQDFFPAKILDKIKDAFQRSHIELEDMYKSVYKEGHNDKGPQRVKRCLKTNL